MPLSPWVGPGKPNLPLGLRGKAGGGARVTAGPKRCLWLAAMKVCFSFRLCVHSELTASLLHDECSRGPGQVMKQPLAGTWTTLWQKEETYGRSLRALRASSWTQLTFHWPREVTWPSVKLGQECVILLQMSPALEGRLSTTGPPEKLLYLTVNLGHSVGSISCLQVHAKAFTGTGSPALGLCSP